ncbi:Maf family protein [Wenxinia saemankumensis]|uniref:Nucleoside triphosphate pyrophosphatase n=1 Tax=Wenxinia saemankumensis TaxID=1447782 RepID=A0A1M6G1Z6_9RHOB|nr:Maf family protein [Wenxinia saemankumensis]SHJ04008.1 septum formation protein [Wenxinia saemankumensis]
MTETDPTDPDLIVASASAIRATLLRNAGLAIAVQPAPIDEPALRRALEAEGASPRDTADALAEAKAIRVSAKRPGALVLGCDQVLDHDGAVLAKPEDPDEAIAQLTAMSGRTHRLLSAAVLAEDGAPKWRHVSTVRMHMAPRSPEWIAGYVERNWDSIRHAVGAYKLEEEGVRLFSRVEGDYFAILGLPLLEVLNHLTLTGRLTS